MDREVADQNQADEQLATDWSHLRRATDESDDGSDPWAWASRDDDAELSADLSRCHVTAVLVTMDADRWLQGTLDGLEHLERRPDRLIAIDNRSNDTTLAMLEQARELGLIDEVYQGRKRFGFGEAVAEALRQDQTALLEQSNPAQSQPAGGDTVLIPAVDGLRDTAVTKWIWLLHDDAAPAPDTLTRMLTHVVRDPTVDITGPKLLLPRRRRNSQQISEVGISISGTGRRDRQIDTDEIDQGQRDEPQQRLAVSTCGMLVRASVWRSLDGFDPNLPVFRDGVEFGWRATLAGHRVVTTPRAVMTHRQVGHAGLRLRGAGGRRPAKMDRELGMVVVAGHAPTGLLPFVWFRLVWGCLLRALGYLVGKVPSRSADEMLALAGFVGHPGRIAALRKRRRELTATAAGVAAAQRLRPPWWNSLRVAGDAVSGVVADRYRSVAGDSELAMLDELTGDDFAAAPAEESKGNPWLSPIMITVLLAVIGSLAAARGLIAEGSLGGPALLPAPDTLAGMWHKVWSPIVGAPAQIPPPWLTLAAIGSTIFAGRPEWFVSVLLLAVVPLALISVYPVVRKAIDDRRLRLWVALSYSLLPVLLGGTNQGRLTLSVYAIMLPLLVLAARALVLRRAKTPEAWRGGWGAGVVLVVLVAFEPSVLIFAALVGIGGAVALRRTPRKVGRIGIALAVPLVVLAPWWPSVIAAPGRLFTGPDSALDAAGPAPATWELLLGRGLGEGLPPLWIGAVAFGVIWLIALTGLVRRPTRRVVLAGWISGLLALAMAVVLSRLVVSVPPVGTEVRPWVGVFIFIAFAALLLAGGVGIDGWSAEVKSRSFTWLQPVVVLAGAILAVIAVGSAAWWVWAGASGPIQRSAVDALPPYVRNAMLGADKARVLAIDLTDADQVRYFVVADEGARLGDADRGFAYGGSAEARHQVDDLVVRVVAGTADSGITPELRDLGIGYVWVSGADDEARSRITNTPGLGTASGNEQGTVWRLEPTVARTTSTTGPDGGLEPVGGQPLVIGAGEPDRQLRLGEPVDPRWRAEVNGQALAPATLGWQQVFLLPPQGGSVTYDLPFPGRWLLLGQAIMLALAGVLAAPAVRRPEVRDPIKTARRAAGATEVSV